MTFSALIHPYSVMYCTLSRDGVLHTQFGNCASLSRIVYEISTMQFKLLELVIQVIQLRKKDKDISTRSQNSKNGMFTERRAAHTSGPRPNDKKKKKKKKRSTSGK